jgi:hypothetical protein
LPWHHLWMTSYVDHFLIYFMGEIKKIRLGVFYLEEVHKFRIILLHYVISERSSNFWSLAGIWCNFEKFSKFRGVNWIYRDGQLTFKVTFWSNNSFIRQPKWATLLRKTLTGLFYGMKLFVLHLKPKIGERIYFVRLLESALDMAILS